MLKLEIFPTGSTRPGHAYGVAISGLPADLVLLPGGPPLSFSLQTNGRLRAERAGEICFEAQIFPGEAMGGGRVTGN